MFARVEIVPVGGPARQLQEAGTVEGEVAKRDWYLQRVGANALDVIENCKNQEPRGELPQSFWPKGAEIVPSMNRSNLDSFPAIRPSKNDLAGKKAS